MKVVAEALRVGFRTGRTRDIRWRLAQLGVLSALLNENEDRIVQALAADLGKPRQEALLELSVVHAELRHTRAHLKRWVRPRRAHTPVVGQPAISHVVPEPLGVVLIISAWNYPFQLVFAPLVNTLAAGNCAVLKPSEIAAHSSRLIAELVPQYLDGQAVAVVEGGVAETTGLLEQRFDHIVFTGSTAVGKIVMAAAAKHLTPLTLELGGKSPCIVDESADVKSAARRIAWGKWLNAGQTCIAPDYVLIHPQRQAALVEAIGEVLEQWYDGRPESGGHYARIINDRHFERLSAFLDNGRIALGGRIDPASRHIEPTVLSGITRDSPIMSEEIFGPILPVLTADSFDEAVDFVTAGDKPLAAYLFARDKRLQRRFVQDISAGNMCINDTLMFMTVPELPFGGVGASGMGQYRGLDGFNRLSHLKAVMKRSRWPELNVRFPPYSDSKIKLLKFLG